MGGPPEAGRRDPGIGTIERSAGDDRPRGADDIERVPGSAWEALTAAVPSGTVTFLFTDIEGSTCLWQAAPDAMPQGLERHDANCPGGDRGARGYVFSTGGDGFASAFARRQARLGARRRRLVPRSSFD